MKRLLIALVLMLPGFGAYAQTAATVGGEASGESEGENGTTANGQGSRRNATTATEPGAGERRGNADAQRNPRWHGFLPGMFR